MLNIADRLLVAPGDAHSDSYQSPRVAVRSGAVPAVLASAARVAVARVSPLWESLCAARCVAQGF